MTPITMLNGIAGRSSLGCACTPSPLGATVLLSDYIGKFYTAKKPFSKFSNAPGDGLRSEMLRTFTEGEGIGRIIEIKKASDGKYWARLSYGGWFNFNAYAPYIAEKVLQTTNDLTAEQKQEIILSIAKTASGPNAVAFEVVETAGNVAKGVHDAASGALDVVDFVGKNLKTILTVALVSAVAYGGYRVYKTVK